MKGDKEIDKNQTLSAKHRCIADMQKYKMTSSSPPSVEVRVGKNNLPYVHLTLSDSSCDVYLFGCTVTSWVSGGIEKLFLSSLAPFDGKKAIRGGIPIVFPVFGQPASIPNDIPSSVFQFVPNPLSQHGFVRTALWTFLPLQSVSDGSSVSAIFSLSETPESLSLWPHKFKLIYKVTLTIKELTTSLTVINTEVEGDSSGGFSFQALLHTYIKIPDRDSIENVRVRGFYNHAYIDKLLPTSAGNQQEMRPIITVDREVDRIYLSSDSEVAMAVTDSASTTDVVRIHSEALYSSGESLPTDTVFWNPWTEKARSMADLPDDAFNSFVCIEPGLVSKWTDLRPGEQVILTQQLSA